jgi:predicted Fe-Mo cluster-binding NifX family protein
MKIAFPLQSKRELASEFSRSAMIGIFNADTRRVDYIGIDHQKEASSGTLLTSLARVEGLTAIMSPRLSAMSLRVLKALHFTVYQADGTNLGHNLRKFASGELPLLESPYASCQGSCSGCESSGTCV